MKNKNSINIILTLVISLIFGINIYYLFFYNSFLDFPDKEPQDLVLDPVNEDITPTIDNTIDNESTIVIEVKDIPVPLDSDIANHLELFRSIAKKLQQHYPQSFILSAPTQEKVVTLTFDDGPDIYTTNEVIDILDMYQVKGTFFFIGQQLSRFPDVVEKAVNGGHTIANHSWSHPRPLETSIKDLTFEIELTESALQSYGESAKVFRPPYGLISLDQTKELNKLDYKVVAWSVDSMDWYFNEPEIIVSCVIDAIHPGAIILMHSAGGKDSRQAVLVALPIIIENLQDLGYSIISLEEMLAFFT